MRVLLTIATLALLAVTPSLGHGQSNEEARDAALAYATALTETVGEISSTLWDYSEIALREQRSAAYLADLLEEEGFTVERGVAGMPTAFVASYGSGAPRIGILAEYDALPGIGNAATPERAERHDGWAHGQGCGHNLFGAASVAAAIAAKNTMQQLGIEGTIRLYGTPAEETVVGKVYMARDGLFDDLDAALDWHPEQSTGVMNQTGQALNNFLVEFRGQAAHAAFDPWNGRSALDAVELMNDGVNLMREHVMPSTRIHYVIPSAGEAPNVVPEYAQVWYYVRDSNRELVERWYDWILDIAAGAAMATRTEHSVFLNTGVHAMLLNRPIQEVLQGNLERVGPPVFSEEDQQFAREMQRFLGVAEDGLDGDLEPLAPGELPMTGGSTDVAEVSRITPTAGITVTTAPQNIPWHSWATAASHGTPGAVKGAVIAAKVLAMTSAELLVDADLRARAQARFAEGMGGQPYQSPVPADQPPPLPKDDSRASGS